MGSGSEETRTGASRPGSDDTANVVRIPRDWFGPKDELVPFGPRAWGEQEQVDQAAARDPLPLDAGAEPTPVPLDADTFWGEDAGSVQDVLEGRPERRRRLSGLIGVAAGLLIAISAVGVATWLSASSRPRTRHNAVVAARTEHRAAPQVVRRTVARVHRARPTPRRHVETKRWAARPASTPVVYHPSLASSAPTAAAGPTSGASVASTASVSHQSAPAFGSNGALGPMSSPDG